MYGTMLRLDAELQKMEQKRSKSPKLLIGHILGQVGFHPASRVNQPTIGEAFDESYGNLRLHNTGPPFFCDTALQAFRYPAACEYLHRDLHRCLQACCKRQESACQDSAYFQGKQSQAFYYVPHECGWWIETQRWQAVALILT